MPVYSPYASPTATIERLQAWGLHTKKSLGQHFLIDDGVVGRILRMAALCESDEVIEIGPGIGTLTEALLAQGVKLLAIEKDKRLLALLEDMRSSHPGRFEFCQCDAMDLDRVLEAQANAQMSAEKLVANLPYAVAARLVLEYFLRLDNLVFATVMVQKEVADRMAAKPGSKSYGAYSVKLQLLANVSDSFNVAPSCFLPPPRVNSTVICLERRPDKPSPELIRKVKFIVEAAFAKRRKTIRNSMQMYFVTGNMDSSIVDDLLERCDISPTLRAEMLSCADYLKLASALEL